MPQVFKGTIIFSGPNHGWTESWYQSRNIGDYTGALADLDTLALQRAQLLGNQNSVTGIRVSAIDAKNDGVANGKKYAPAPAQDCDSDEPDACVVLYAHDQQFQRRKCCFLRGIPDAIDIQFGTLTTDPCGWQKQLDRWWGRITNKTNPYGWIGRPAAGPTRSNVTGYVTDASGNVTITFATPLFGATPVGTRVKVGLSGINAPAKSVLNGQQVVTVAAANSCVTVYPIAVFPFDHGGVGLFSPLEFIPAFDYTLSRIGTRRVGAPLLASRGRQRVRGRG